MRIRKLGKEISLHKTVKQDRTKREGEEERKSVEAHTEILMGPLTTSSGFMVVDLRGVC